MPRSGSGDARYVQRAPRRLPPVEVDGVDLGPPMLPQDLLGWLRQIEALEDKEIVEAFGRALERDPAEIYPALTEEDVAAMIEAAADVTTSRVMAWRKRNRQMTWLEMRMLLIGLREMEL